MDDLMLYGRNAGELKGLKTVQWFSDAIGMEFGFDKFAKATILRGSLQRSSSISSDTEVIIKDLEQEKSYMRIWGEGIHH